MENIKLIVLYQVIMHYRLPLYERLEEDPNIDSQIFYGKGQEGTKLISANLQDSPIKHKKHSTIRIPFKTNNGKGTIPFSPFLFFSLVSNSPDVILSEGASSIINSSIAFIYSKIFGKKFIWWSLGKLEGRKHSGIRALLVQWERYIAKKSDAIFTYSSLGRRHFVNEGVKLNKIFVGVNVLDTNRKLKEISKFNSRQENFNLDKNQFNIAFIGSITKEKNLEYLIHAVKLFNSKYKKKAVLHIIGDGNYMSDIQSITKDDDHQVIMYGRINEGASRILNKCDLMVLPGLGGLAICEAMLNRLPVLTGKADGTEYDLINENCGFILPEITIESIFKKVEYLYLNPLERVRMGNEAYKRITTDLHFDEYYQKLIEAIQFTKLKS